jgi:uncharacterized protein (TIGR02453 family)
MADAPTVAGMHADGGALMAVESAGFVGFQPDALTFLADLAEHNDRAWFQPRKADYERLLKEPMESLVATLDEGFAARGIPLRADPKRSIFRIYRDTRFSKDKSPYKTKVTTEVYTSTATTSSRSPRSPYFGAVASRRTHRTKLRAE